MATIRGFYTIEVSTIVSEKMIELRQDAADPETPADVIQFPPDRADELIAAIKAAKKEINEAAKA